MTRLRAGGATDVGLARANNQDQLLMAFPIFAVADGMGGHAAGEVASLTAVEALQSALEGAEPSPAAVVEAARAANRAVWERAQSHAEMRGMGTTLTAIALVHADGGEMMSVVNVGDSRTYRLRDGGLEQLTADHSYVAELVAGGQIDEAEAEVHPQRHVLTRALGVSLDVDVDLRTLALRPHDRFLLCSDGLSRELTDAQIASTLRRLADPGEAARELVTEAKLHGGNDNITVVVVDVIGDALDPEVEEGPPTRVMSASAAGSDAAPVDGAGANQPSARSPTPTAAPAGHDAGQDLTASVPRAGLAHPPPPAGSGVAVAEAVAGTGGTRAEAGSRPAGTTPEGGPGYQRGAEPAGRNRRPGRRRAEGGGNRRQDRRAAKAAQAPKARLITLRVIGFFLLLVAIVAVAWFGSEYYARDSYYVGLDAGQLTIYKGRPGGVLWWKPTIAMATGVTTSEVEAYHLAALRAGVQETTMSDARSYVRRLQAESAAAGIPTSTAPTTTDPTTTAPTTTAATTTARTSAAPTTTVESAAPDATVMV